MNRRIYNLLLFTILLVAAFLSSCSEVDPVPSGPELTLWYDEPAEEWTEALPVGNSRLGAMVFGRTDVERIQLNEKSLWCQKGDYEDRDGSRALPAIRKLLFEGKYREAEDLLVKDLMQERLPTGTNAYQTLGDLRVEYLDTSEVTAYKRSLLLDSALVRVDYSRGGHDYQRTVFSSAHFNVLVYKERVSKGGKISCNVRISRPGEGEVVWYRDDMIVMKQHVENGNGVVFETRVKILINDGHLHVTTAGLEIHGTTDLEIRVFAATNYEGEAKWEECEQCMRQTMTCNYTRVLTEHVAKYQELFNRVSLDLGSSATRDLPTDERLAQVQKGSLDPGLAALYFNYGRYLLISSSRPGSLPANLQGIWNEHLEPPWNSDYHININLQMNYWPAEVTNLSECHEPYLRFIAALMENGRETASKTYNSRGFVAHHATDVWHQTQLFGSPSWGMWPMGAAWSATHYWEHYLFNGDFAYLSDTGYVVMREAALFLSDFLVEHPRTGKLVTGPSISPENRFVTPEGDTAAISMGPAMDLQIVWHLFTSVIEASKVLGRDAEFRALLEEQLEQLAPVEIGRDGRILEWSEEGLKELEPGHRHMSHLYGLHPSPQYNWADTPEYMEAAEKVLEQRLRNGGGHTGWSRAWIINFYARLKDAEEAHDHLGQLLEKSTLPNLFDTHPPFQIDGNFGGTAGIAEMLIQSHSGYVELLPALPDEWSTGRVSGLMARGGFQVDMAWQDGEITELEILSKLGNVLDLRFATSEASLITYENQVITLEDVLRVL